MFGDALFSLFSIMRTLVVLGILFIPFFLDFIIVRHIWRICEQMHKKEEYTKRKN